LLKLTTALLLYVTVIGAMAPTAYAANARGVAVTIPQGTSAGGNYSPSVVTVVIGVNNTVTWTNNDANSHTVTPVNPGASGWTSSGTLSPGATYSFTFTVAGGYDYMCQYHNFMTGTVFVKAATTPTPEFPALALPAILFAVIAMLLFVAPRLRGQGASSRYSF
jgi:plastocyanin